MAISDYMTRIREKIGHDLLLAPGVAAIIRNEGGQILVQRNKEGIWNLPAGAIDPGEKPAQAIIREVFEETGLIVRPIKVIGVLGGSPEYRQEYPNGDVVESTTIVFACEVVGGKLKPQDDETGRLEYRPSDEMPEMPTAYPQHFYEDNSTSGFFEWDETWLAGIDEPDA
jgi:8-oxo-dGTP pyrophosphatase MutT (NUDIX family)